MMSGQYLECDDEQRDNDPYQHNGNPEKVQFAGFCFFGCHCTKVTTP
jgi:hypothetical protein